MQDADPGALSIEPPHTEERLADVAVALPMRQTFTYRVPSDLVSAVRPGVRVEVPFGPRKLPGWVVRVHMRDGAGAGPAPPPSAKLRSIAQVIEADPTYDEELLGFLVAAADYYLYPVGEALRAGAPGVVQSSARSRWELTDRARQSMAAAQGDERVVLDAVAARGRVPRQMRATADRLRTRGWLSRVEEVQPSRVRARREIYVRAAPAEGTGRLGARQKTLLDRIRSRGEVALGELRKHTRAAGAIVRALVAKGWATTEERELAADPFFEQPLARDTPPTLVPAQRAAASAIVEAIGTRAYAAFLLHGVTGSGKTEVYLRAIAAAREAGRSALVLAPEIALTPQLVARYRARFGDDLAVLHSGLSDRQRFDHWRALRSGAIRVAIGARSAIFAPVRHLGLVVVDEEHDGSFKQEDGFLYNARDMALLRTHRAGAVAVLGSATPSMESIQGAHQGRLRLLELPERATVHALPEVEIVDLRRFARGALRVISPPLAEALRRTLSQGEQAILFLNRRGFAPSVRCEACAWVARCPSCAVALTLHRRAGTLCCHYCDHARHVPNRCEACAAPLVALGLGTERLAEEVARDFGGARVVRLDRDVATAATAPEVLASLARGEANVLIGTQMVAKGHDLPGVTLVGVILADQGLHMPDFRASERTFQLLVQVAGRAGRGARSGRVIVQTYSPDHPSVRLACAHSYAEFVAEEAQARRELGYPPFGRMAAIRVDAPTEAAAEAGALAIDRIIRARVEVESAAVRVLGPAPPPIARLRNRFRQRLLLLGPDREPLRRVLKAVLGAAATIRPAVRLIVDVDPVQML